MVPLTSKWFDVHISMHKHTWWAPIASFLLSFHPFYFPGWCYCWKQKKRFTLNHFKGYQWFDLHYSPPRDRGLLDGGVSSEHMHTYFGFTAFYLRVEFHFMWGFRGPSWYRFGKF
jgi:hypothetical protein